MSSEDADQRTLEASEHRLGEATRKGEWPVSDLIPLALTWPLVAMAIAHLLPGLSAGMVNLGQHLWSPECFAGEISPGALLAHTVPGLLAPLAGLALVLVTSVTMLTLAQKGFVFKDPMSSARAPVPTLPFPGIAAGASKLAGSLARLALVLAALSLVLTRVWPPEEAVLPMIPQDLHRDHAKLFALFLVFGIGDYLFRRRAFLRSLMMTPAEARAEAKELDGDPRVKGRIRQRALRPIAASPYRTVLITDADAVAVVMLFADETQTPRICLAARGEGGLRLKEQYMAQEAPVIPVGGLAPLLPSLRPMDGAPASLHPALAAVHRELYPGGGEGA